MRAHIIKNGKVVNTIEVQSLDFLPNLVSAEQGGAIGDHYENGVLTKTKISLSEAKASRIAELAGLRYEKEIAGIKVNGASIETDRASQAMINGAWSISQINPAILIDWKTATGAWVQIDAATIAGIAVAVAGHVQACFSNERVHAEAIEALETAEAIAAYDLTTGWHKKPARNADRGNAAEVTP